MKTILFALSLFAATFMNRVAAAEVIENPQVSAAFTAQFGRATNAEWSETGSLYKVRFTLDGVVSSAWYNGEGALVAVTRQQSVDSLPAALRQSLRTALQHRWVTDLTEVETGNGTTWYVTLENADRKEVLQSIAGRKWVRYEQSTKL